MNENATRVTLSEDDLRQRDAFIANQRVQQSRSKFTVLIVAAIVTLMAIGGGFYAVNSHRATLAANAKQAAQENARAQKQAALEAAAQAERDFQAAYAGRLESWEIIMHNRNPIKGWPVRRREAILNDIAAKESEIEGIRSQMRSITTQHSNASGSIKVDSYNKEQMHQLWQQMNRAEGDLYQLQTELRRDDYFEGRIAGYDL